MHATSPLRRYPDLVNIRQLKAFLAGTPLPYSEQDLILMADYINHTLTERAAARVAQFKAWLKLRTAARLAMNDLMGVPDAVLAQAVKMVKEAGSMEPSIQDELLRRFKANTISDKVVDALVTRLPYTLWPAEVVSAYFTWLKVEPHRVMHTLAHGDQSGFFTYKLNFMPIGNGKFGAYCRISRAATHWIATGTGSSIRNAERLAAQAAVEAFMFKPPLDGRFPSIQELFSEQALKVAAPDQATTQEPVEVPTDAPTEKAAEEPTKEPVVSAKGALFEFCSKKKLPSPKFTMKSQGPNHAKTFEAKIVVELYGVEHSATGSGKNTKQAQDNASQTVLDSLLAAPEPVAQKATIVAKSDKNAAKASDKLTLVAAHFCTHNFKGFVLEQCQKEKLAAPVLVMASTGPANAPQFTATLTWAVNGKTLVARGIASIKKSAEQKAYAELVRLAS